MVGYQLIARLGVVVGWNDESGVGLPASEYQRYPAEMSISGDLFLLSLDPSGYGRMHPVELGCALIGAELVDLAVLGRIAVEATRIRHLDQVGSADQFDNPMLRARMKDLKDESDAIGPGAGPGPGPDDLLRAGASHLVDTYDGVWAESKAAGTDPEQRDTVLERIVRMVMAGSGEMADEVLLALTHTAKLTDHLVSKLRRHGLHKKLNARAEQCSRFWTSSSEVSAVVGYGGVAELHSSIRCALTAAARFAADPASLKGPSTLGAAWGRDPRGGLPYGVME